MAHNDYGSFLYLSGVIVIAEVATGVGCNDPTGDCPKVNSLKKSSLESGWGSRVTLTNYNS